MYLKVHFSCLLMQKWKCPSPYGEGKMHINILRIYIYLIYCVNNNSNNDNNNDDDVDDGQSIPSPSMCRGQHWNEIVRLNLFFCTRSELFFCGLVIT